MRGEQGGRKEQDGSQRSSAARAARRMLTVRLPLWSVLVMLFVVAGLFLALLLSQDEVDLGPGVDGAVEASVSLTLCNETVDRRGINPRTAELDLQEGLRDAGAKEASVTVNRVDCGPEAP